MADHIGAVSPAAVVESVFAAFGDRDPDAIAERFHPQGELALDGGLALLTGARHAGRREIRAWFAEWFALTEGSEARLERHGLVGERLLLFASQRSRSASTGAPGETRFAAICTFEDGLIARFELYADRHTARKAMGLERWPWDRNTVAAEPYDSADAAELRHELSCELLERYGRDSDPEERPDSERTLVFLVARDAEGRAVGCGALLDLDEDAAEIKRMFVRRHARGQDVARRLLEGLEREAADRGFAACRLETGERQPEAMHLYRSAGYKEIERFGPYRDAPLSRCFERELD